MHADVKGILSDLVAFRTVSSDSNLDCIDYIKTRLTACGARMQVQFNEDGNKANLLATIGPDGPGGVVLSGHTDVVPTDGQIWETDPWQTVEKDGRIYGRGTTDMKGFLAAMLMTAERASTMPLLRPIHFAFSYDEELGCLGAWPLAQMMKEQLGDLVPIIVGEPTRSKVVARHKGIVTFNTTVKGYSVHSSRVHEGVSAVTESARLIAWLDDLMRQEAKTELSEVFDPPFTTIHCGMISGGAAVNVVASHCSFSTDVRTIAGKDPQHYMRIYKDHIAQNVLPRLRTVHPSVDITVTQRSFTPGFDPEADNPAETLARQLTGDNDVRAVSYATEAGVFQKNGFHVVVCGPGDIAQAHQANEYIEVKELERCEELLARLASLQCV